MPNTCVYHPEREAVFTCVHCGRHFCTECSESSDEEGYCFDCLEDVALDSKRIKYGEMTPSLAIGIGSAIIIGFLILRANLDNLVSLVTFASKFFRGAGPPQFEMVAAAISVVLLVCYIAVAIAMVANKRWAIPFGLALNIFAVFLNESGTLPLAALGNGAGEFLLVNGMLVALTVSLVMNRGMLSH